MAQFNPARVSDAFRMISEQILLMDNPNMEEIRRRHAIIDERIEARLLNMHAIHDVAPLYPLRLWNGEMPGQEFPANLGALRALTAPQLRGLLRTYELDIPDGRAARLERFARFIGAYELLNL